ncbi:PH domain-containing protein [Stenotrophomonas lacuserhaii]|uniref:PH domain-containing protein n=1 Tax=Stenotrophomonas lacuserhaii TaxID=2760084 RepID=UPI0015F9F7E0|nr:PH domain-containing protein [Stenotrophomonas lacuserhaii]
MSTAPPPLPSADQERRLHRWSWLFVLILQLRQYLLPLVALLVFGQRGDRDPLWAQLGPLIVIVVLVLASVLQYLSYRYRIGEEGISIRSGVFSRNRREIPFARIHNVVVHQNLLHRLFGVAELRLESAGGNRPEAEMRVLRLDEALALEQRVRHRGPAPQLDAGRADDGTPPPLPEADERHLLLRMTHGEVVKLGLLSNRGWVMVAAALAALVQVVPRRSMDAFVEQGGRQAFGYASGLQPGISGLLLIAAGLLIAGWLILRALSVLLALLRYYGFELSEQQRRLTVSSGLLSKVRSSVALRRIQAWTLSETLLQRWAGRRQLRIDSAASQGTEDHQQRGLRELAPLATPQACDALVSHLLPQVQWPPAQWQPVPLRGSWRLCLTSLWLTPVLAAGLTWRWGYLGLLVLAWIPVALWTARLQMARIGWHLDGQHVALRGGWWRRWWRWAELDKLQALRLSRSPLDRLLGTSSVWLDTAGARGDVALCLRYLPQAQAAEVLETLGAALARRKLRW